MCCSNPWFKNALKKIWQELLKLTDDSGNHRVLSGVPTVHTKHSHPKRERTDDSSSKDNRTKSSVPPKAGLTK
ncbi:hypothetical protein ANCCAN_01869 [Ancylostoma caninum]|uniref:Uncharacterized protein n=1 Tax=Ancylostoma caninum TaxID=29170 RepID=A0A368H653_ANCCA|nr:hypothetical protein ANCCAN_01869 [Ancylostoma caninum]